MSTVMPPAPDSFQVRVTAAVKGHYQTSMRRSLQSVALYEADRCLKNRYSQLRPFQKKYALFATAVDLLSTLDFLNEYHRQEIMFRTNASKEPLAPDLAWRRMKLITREINQTILPKAKALLEDDANKEKSHDVICEILLQNMFEENSEKNSKPYPSMWEFNHNNVFSVYRIYFRGVTLDPNIFPARLLRMVPVPLKKPDTFRMAHDASSLALANLTINASGRNNFDVSEDDRRAMLKEVKDHTELLKSFEGIVPDEEIAKRKRALYAALPPVPPPYIAGAVGPVITGKRQRKKAKVAGAAKPLIPSIPAMSIPPVVATPEVVKPEATTAMSIPPVVATPEVAKPEATTVPETTKPTAMDEEADWENVDAVVKEEEQAKVTVAV
eukprot:CAMPEP_0196139714 /NCGR_PEP_ID=MMETSP0910-20130528/6886_1 /TAXON_ID=49265 /ORGANISM="Thalassiosira rotula, Strain GSO102" /LENGTH=383 /DNA_ID=CAMNT_0041400471 /DNA_START=446 /DNA_END=1597 /DNA_ORIENTATION=+